MKTLLCRFLLFIFIAELVMPGLAAPGDVEAGFSPNANQVVLGAAMQPDGKIVIGGDFDIVSWGTRNKMARINADSTLDADFDPNVGGGRDFKTPGHALQK